MGGMPYHLEKGPIFATIEALYNDNARLPGFLHSLWQGGSTALGSLGMLTSPMYNNPNAQGSNATGKVRKESMRRDWFGEDPAVGPPQRPFDKTSLSFDDLTTGYWFSYYGEVREIVAETLTRAAEVALGVDRPDPPPAAPPATPPAPSRYWPVEFFWKCGQPRFEGWVTWRDHGQAGSGQVTVIFATPATPDQVLRRPGDEADLVRGNAWDKWQGMWVCTHSDHDQYVVITSWPTDRGRWFVPMTSVMLTKGEGPVDTWAPRFPSGGAAEEKKPFEPGT